MDMELGRREDLEDLVERAESARQGDERIRKRQHMGFALLHIGRDDQLVGRFGRRLEMPRQLWQDADDLCPVVPSRAGGFAHQSDAAAAEDEAKPRSPIAEPSRRAASA